MQIDNSPSLRNPVFVAVLSVLIALPLILLVLHAVEIVIEQKRIAQVEEAIKSLGESVKAHTIDSNIMGASVLLGLTDEHVKAVALGENEYDSPEAVEIMHTLVAEYCASNAFVVSAQGRIVAYYADGRISGTGKSVSHRPYYQQAMKGIPNVYAAVGSSTKKRGWYCSAPIYSSTTFHSKVIGAMVIKKGLEKVDAVLRNWDGKVALVSPEGVVFSTNSNDWIQNVVGPVTKDRHTELLASKRYGSFFTADKPPVALPIGLDDKEVVIDGISFKVVSTRLNLNDINGDWTLVGIVDTSNWFAFHARVTIVALILISILALGQTISLYGRNRYDKKIARQERLLNARKISAMSNAVDDALIMISGKGLVMFWNHAAERLFGYTASEAIGQTIHELVTPDELREKARFGLEKFATSGGGNIFSEMTQTKAIRRNGEEFFAEVSIAPFQVEDKWFAVGTVRDITERLKAEKELSDAYELVTSSINYATNIQHSILPSTEKMDALCPEHFVLWEPRDLVGGDIYFCKPFGRGKAIALGDCTGHGVPGAFMTMIANGALDMGTLETPPGDPARLLQRTHQLIQRALGQEKDDGRSDDGMEMGMVYLAPKGRKMVYAGARFSLFIVENGQVQEIRGDKNGLGYRGLAHDVHFTNYDIPVGEGRTYYMTTDGFIDQIGGEKRRGFGKKRFKKLLLELEDIPMDQRGEKLKSALIEYQGAECRRDDVAIIGFKTM
ncbi:MAG: PAS domain S-box protein [Desulfovibrio sp.]